MGNGNNGVVVDANDITRTYGQGDTAVQALRGVSVDIASGKLTARKSDASWRRRRRNGSTISRVGP